MNRKPRGKRQSSMIQPGAAPGAIVIDPNAPPPALRAVTFNDEEVHDFRDLTVDQVAAEFDRPGVLWLDVIGLGDEKVLRDLGDIFQLHRLVLEDVVNTQQRAKIETYDDQTFVIARMANAREESEQLSLILGPDYVVTFQERTGDPFEPVRERIRHGRGRVRREGADYLAYALLDAVVDGYFPVLDGIGDEIEDLEEVVLERPTRETIAQIHDLRRRLVALRRSIAPHRELFNAMVRDLEGRLGRETIVHLRDTYDHTIRLTDLVESYREMSADLMSTYLSQISNRMNEVMKVLTIIATIFIPLGFVAGLYGMNFDPSVSPWNMPELGWRYGYPFALGVMFTVGVGMFLWFRRKGWFD